MRDESIKEIYIAHGVALEDQGGGSLDLAPSLYAAARALLRANESPESVSEVPSEQLASTVDRATKRVSALVDRILRTGAATGQAIFKDPAEAVALIISDIRAKASPTAGEGMHLSPEALEEVLRQHLQTLLATASLSPAWQPMVTAPKDRPILLRRPGRSVGIGHWESQAHHRIPRPYWRDERPVFGVAEDRGTEPTGWMDIPHG